VTVRDDLLIDAAALAAALDRPDAPTLLDVRWRLAGPPARDDYAAGHLPGAVFVDLDADLCGPPGAANAPSHPPSARRRQPGPRWPDTATRHIRAGRHPLPDPDRLQAVLRRAGVRTGHPVVVYDLGDGVAAARAWWTLRWAGHRPVRVLDGGYPAWVAAGHPVTVDVPTPYGPAGSAASHAGGPGGSAPGDLTVTPGGMPVLDAAGAARLAGEGVLIDVRAPARYRGETEPIDPVAGHISGAVNLPTTAHVLPDGRLRGEADIAADLKAVGVEDGRPVGAYCGSGVAAAHTVLALHLAGRPDAALYVGSWSEWITDPRRPVATGEGVTGDGVTSDGATGDGVAP
jgi:thiosulfate/3-mercaptopyruvate sulfurtransferase